MLLGLACAEGRSDPGSTTPPATPSPTPTGDFGGGEPCPDIRDGRGCRSVLTGDLDGDGTPDEIRVYAHTLESGFPESWVLEAELGSGEVVRARGRWWPGSVVGAPPEGADWWSGYPETVAVFDLDGDGTDEAFVKVVEHVLHGGSVPDHVIFDLRRKSLVPLRGEDGETFLVPLGGVSYFGHGLRCADTVGNARRELVVLRVENAATSSPDWSMRFYELRGTKLVLVLRREGVMTREGFPDPDVDAFYHLRCDGVRIEPW